MSMQIEFNDDYSETTYYYGTVKLPDRKDSAEYRFTVSTVYFSNLGNWTINEIVWDDDGPPEKKDKAETRITEIVMNWHGDIKGRCISKQDFADDCMITYNDPGDEND